MRGLRLDTLLSLLVVTIALSVTACTGEAPPEAAPATADQTPSGAPIPPTGDLIAGLDGVFTIFAGSSTADPSRIDADKAPDIAVPGGVEALGSGVSVELREPLDGAVEVRLPLPARPNDEAVPAVLHVGDDGAYSVIPAAWDEPANEVVIWTSSFSDDYAAWFNPVTWAKGGAQIVGGAIDYLADWMTGRTDPPACGRRPEWAHMAAKELSSVHACLQTNRAQDGSDRAEILLKSNRQTLQMITIPSTTKDYLWVEGGNDTWRSALTSVLGADPQTSVLLQGGDSMSMGFRRPATKAEGEIQSYQTYPIVLLNPVSALLGGLIESQSGGNETTLAVTYLVLNCADKIGGTDIWRGDIVAKEVPSADKIKAGVECVLDLVMNPKFAAATVAKLIRSSGVKNVPAGFEQRVEPALRRVEPAAKKALRAFAVANVLTSAWDGIFDNLAEGSLTFRLDPRAAAGTSTSNDPTSLWERWKILNDDCRGGQPGAAQAAACDERDKVQRQQAVASADAFLAAWRVGNVMRMKELSTANARDNVGRPLVPSLLAMKPGESGFDMTYDVEQTGKVSAYIRTTDGVDLYFEWADIGYQDGWLVKSYAPDVG
ncbi:hypothetical protein [Pseudonocardia sp. T1-2H]|uniref:hypothetical protein n=1 Tax=Pseudonocardia sp. T1-2H TaxID=3128899 RepID=UPI0031012ED9